MREALNLQRNEWRQWRQFAVLADELHFGRAALRLHMTQPALTQAIASLEASLGVRLFERNRRAVALSAAGAAVLPEVRQLLERAQALPGLAQAAASGQSGRLRIAFVSTAGFELLPRRVRAFRQRWPQVALELVEATGDVQLEMLARGDIDAGFVLHSPGWGVPGLASAPLTREPLVLALPESHPLAPRARPAWHAVLDEPLVIFPRRILPTVFDAIVALYAAAGRVPVVAQEAIQMQTIVNLVAAGLGVAWVPQSVREFRRAGVVYRPVGAAAGQRIPLCESHLVWRAEGMTPPLQRFIEIAQAQ